MSFIILDLEWDYVYCKKHARFVNQILQIGAVKLDNDFNIADSIEITVKSSITKKVSTRFSELTGITTESMLSGIPLPQAVEKYNEWAGKGNVTMTWSTSDLYTILENEEYILDGAKSFNIEKYIDLQKFVQGEIRLLGNVIDRQISLSTAAEMLGISTDGYHLHNAECDSIISAATLKKCYNEKRFWAMVKDTSESDFYERLKFKPYNISNINDKCIDRKALKFNCEKCGMPLVRSKPWKYRNRWFSSRLFCKKCKTKYTARVSFKKTYDSVVVSRRLLAASNETEKAKNEMQSLPQKL